MGCATSAERALRRRRSPFSPVRRSSTTHVHHVASLSSSAVGSTKTRLGANAEGLDPGPTGKSGGRVAPRTPVRTPRGEPETINAWELMAGLEEPDDEPEPRICHTSSYNLPLPPEIIPGAVMNPASPEAKGAGFWTPIFSPEKPPPAGPGAKGSGFGSPGFSPEIHPPAPDKNPPASPGAKWSGFGSPGFSPEIHPPAPEKNPPASPGAKGSGFGSPGFSPEIHPPSSPGEKESGFGVLPKKALPVPELEAVVVYYTSLRGIRRTYEDCRDVRRILRSIGVKIDERDVSMDSGFRDELRGLTGGSVALPGVFIGKEYIGGAEEIRRLHEDGGLERVFERCERAGGGACGGCGGVRFVPCEDCSGSCKIYSGDGSDGDGEAEAEDCGFQRCRRCNENGLVRCPLCCCY